MQEQHAGLPPQAAKSVLEMLDRFCGIIGTPLLYAEHSTRAVRDMAPRSVPEKTQIAEEHARSNVAFSRSIQSAKPLMSNPRRF